MRQQQRSNPRNANSHRINHQIRIPEVRVIGPEGAQLGIMSPREGYDIAQEHGLDLVEVAPQAKPPVCRIMDYGKVRYQQSKRKTKSKRVVVKEIRLRPKTDDHDLETKIRKAESMLEKGNTIRLVMRLRGRENAYKSRWLELMRDVAQRFTENAKITGAPRIEGRTITATLEPITT
ncbi:MAG: translation initiation factor IF-3 [Myxococcota bacterium]